MRSLFKDATIAISIAVTVACGSAQHSALKQSSGSTTKPTVKFRTVAISKSTFKDFSPGDIETSATFPRLYILQPELELLGLKKLSIKGRIKGDGFDRSTSAPYNNGEWSSVSKNIGYLSESLLGVKNPSLAIELTDEQGLVTTENYDLRQSSVINPFIELQVLTIDFSSVQWMSQSMPIESGGVLNLSLVLSENDERIASTAARADFSKSGAAPSSIQMLLSQDRLNKFQANGTMIVGSADGTKLDRVNFEIGRISGIVEVVK